MALLREQLNSVFIELQKKNERIKSVEFKIRGTKIKTHYDFKFTFSEVEFSEPSVGARAIASLNEFASQLVEEKGINKYLEKTWPFILLLNNGALSFESNFNGTFIVEENLEQEKRKKIKP